jgi:nicotinamidase/pyrazinamidase
MTKDDKEVLLIVDVQNDFCPGGALAVPDGDEIVPAVNRLAAEFEHVILTQDWHPAGHASFVDVPHAELVLRKGYRRAIDSYSAFRENDRQTPTGLANYLRERGLEHITLCGLATDFCVFYSAVDGREAGFEVSVVTSACRGINVEGSIARAMRSMSEAGVTIRP